jgi:hypothetical protein
VSIGSRIDTTIIKPISIFPVDGSQRLILHYYGNNWRETTYWTIYIIAGNDTLISQSDSSSYYDWELENSSLASQRDSILDAKRKFFLNYKTKLDIDTVKPADERRETFRKFSLSEFSIYLKSKGYSEQQINEYYMAFWKYYENRNILIFALPNPNPPNELAYAFDPNTRIIIPFYAPY